jgi:flagellar motor switch protein FliN/FliY
MSELTPEIASQVLAACRAGAVEAESALGRALGGEFAITVGESSVYTAGAASVGFDGPGLAFLWNFGDVGMAGVLPAASGLVPDWCATPDEADASKLATLAQELGALVAPPGLLAVDSKARHVESLADTLARARVAPEAALAAIDLKCAGKTGQLSLIWPLEAPEELLPVVVSIPAASQPAASPFAGLDQPTKVGDLSALPKYSRSLLKIRVPVSVQLATKKELVQEVIALAPGSIIKFEKGCEELLQMVVGEHFVAEGEAVKIGEKFGFRVTSMLLPPEHFVPVKRPRRA